MDTFIAIPGDGTNTGNLGMTQINMLEDKASWLEASILSMYVSAYVTRIYF